MSLRQLTEADCGQYNPLVQLTTHLTRDHTLGENYGQFPSSSDQLVQQFLEETRVAPQTFRMDDLMQEMHEIESQRAAIPPVPASTVKDYLRNDVWAVEYLKHREQSDFQDMHSAQHGTIWAEIIARESDQIENNEFEKYLMESRKELEWMEPNDSKNAIARELQATAGDIVDVTDDNKFAYSKVNDGNVVIDNDVAQDWSEEYVETVGDTTDDTFVQAWNNEQTSLSGDGESSSKFWDNLQDEWKKLAEQDTSDEHPWISEFNEFYDPYKEYEFNETNPMTDIPNSLDKGKELLERGDLPGAVLCFEAAARQDPNCAEAWQLLGTTQAENEQDPYAISALKKCLELEPNNLKVLMALAVSYTNENYHHQACQSLVSWLRHHPEYSDILPPNFQLSGDQHKVVQELYIKAAQRQPVNPDYEVQCGLGVLFNLSGEYDKAADCFRVALNVKPEDSRLWNRLGATLANGNHPEEAVESYHHALNLAPGFIRARYNVGITCINLGAYKEAAEHFMIALNQQARGRDLAISKVQMSETIWTTLRMCISFMNRADLLPTVDDRNLNVLNEALDIHED